MEFVTYGEYVEYQKNINKKSNNEKVENDNIEGYNKTEIIENVIIDNFVIEKQTEKGEKNIYAPTNTETEIFKNAKENISEKITYTGELDSNIKEHKISNQGGLIAFRYANDNIATYISNEQEQIEYNKLLQNTNTQINDLKAKISFDLILNLKSNKSFKATISLDIPAKDNIIEDGTSSTEITDLTDIIFKRDE